MKTRQTVHAELIDTKVINQTLLRAACELNLALFEAQLFSMPQAVIDANLKLRDAIALAQEAR